MTKHKTLHLFWAAFPLSLLILLLQVMPGLAQRAANKPDSVDTWTFGPNLPSTVVRAVGVFFPANGKFYAMGGRSADGTGNDLLHPAEYNPGTNTWTLKAAMFSDNHVDNMGCGVLTQGGTPYIFCVGGSFGGGADASPRVARYDPVADVMTDLTAADNWPGDANLIRLPGGHAVVGNKLYIIGGFEINVDMSHEVWVFDPNAAVGSRWTRLADYPADRGYIPTAAYGPLIFTAGGSLWDGTTIHDTVDSFRYNTLTDTWTAITNIPRVVAETRALNVYGTVWVMGGGRDAPNPNNEVDIYDPRCNTWTVSTQPFVTPRRNFPTDTDGGSRVWLAGGYAPATPDITMEIYRAPAVTSAVSRKVHGGAGTFDVPLPLNGPAGVECRTGPTYTMVVTFSTSVTVASATVTCGTGSVGSISGSGTATITVNLTGVTDVQRITVTLNSVSDGTNTGNIPIFMGVLVGDVNANNTVNASDVSLTKSKVGQTVDSTNFREDVNAGGTITATDVTIVKSDVGHALP
ncbi:MAG: hypothetical protein DMF17_05905 [Verrucomicrobia bacterium]|nr:MAG: hypothetical protein DMF17_05905 [Verrucomicrobiota bacterium]